MKVTIRPSGESAGWLTESGSLVTWTHSDRLEEGALPPDQTAPATANAAIGTAAIAAIFQRFPPRCAFSIALRASTMLCRRRVASLWRQRCNTSRMIGGVERGNAVQ